MLCATEQVPWMGNVCVLPAPIPALGSTEMIQILGIIPNLITGTFTALHLGIFNRPMIRTKAGHIAIPVDQFANGALPEDWPNHIERDASLSPDLLLKVEQNLMDMIGDNNEHDA